MAKQKALMYDPEAKVLIPMALASAGKKAKQKFEETFAQEHLWWILPLFVWSLGMYVLFEWTRNKIQEAYIGNVVMPLYGMFQSLMPWLFPIQEIPWVDLWKAWDLWMKSGAQEEKKNEIQLFWERMRIWIVIWTVLCALLAVWLYSKKQERQRERYGYILRNKVRR